MKPRHVIAGAVAATLLASTLAVAAQPYPPYPPYPPPPPPAYRPPPPLVVDPNPPPLSTTMRVIYAPFYAAGLVLRYSVYYVLVAPFEVLGRALTYGPEGGVERRQPPPPPPPPSQDQQQ